MKATPIRIALADDQELFIESLSVLLGNTDGAVEVLWTARSGQEALSKTAQAQPDVLLMDYSFRGQSLDGAEVTRMLLEHWPSLKVLMLSVSDDLGVIRESLQKGALGYISKETSKGELLQAIRSVSEGKYFLDQTALRELIGAFVKKHPKTLLTRRELEVAELYADDLPVRDIARTLYISEDTVESHIKNLRSKTGATRRAEVREYLKKVKG
ncbi:MAG TPA: response regulator transcription factor [Saprospiraceae bacterium]|nr:response regulator transcription factor [Saprospiraceae bacterium]HND88002.1 response regulator transcription factor [Saprospiraceae bacterium]